MRNTPHSTGAGKRAARESKQLGELEYSVIANVTQVSYTTACIKRITYTTSLAIVKGSGTLLDGNIYNFGRLLVMKLKLVMVRQCPLFKVSM